MTPQDLMLMKFAVKFYNLRNANHKTAGQVLELRKQVARLQEALNIAAANGMRPGCRQYIEQYVLHPTDWAPRPAEEGTHVMPPPLPNHRIKR